MEMPDKTNTSTWPKNRLREERERQGWSQKDLAGLMNLPDTRTVWRWQNGHVFPRPHYILGLCHVFGKSVEELGLLKQLSRLSGQESTSQTSQNEASPLWKVPSSFTSCIGRIQEIGAICKLLQQTDVRCLTIRGPGGIGKTRL